MPEQTKCLLTSSDLASWTRAGCSPSRADHPELWQLLAWPRDGSVCPAHNQEVRVPLQAADLHFKVETEGPGQPPNPGAGKKS